MDSRLCRDSVKHLEARLWELRITGRDGISRVIYVTAAGAWSWYVRSSRKLRRRRRANWRSRGSAPKP
nr:type II toxin-antitoxin system RelE/ParE family toxin [Rhodopseudomonas palustris]